MDKNLFKVLWVEDDPNITLSYPMEAANYGIELNHFACWEDAEQALLSDFFKWTAIILDAKCKYKKDSHDNAAQFLTQAINSISIICANRNRVIPWFVLSGGAEEELNDLIFDSREQWDADWHKKFYSKTTDRTLLFQRIRLIGKRSAELQMKQVYYPDVFDAVERLDLDPSFEKHMLELLVPIHATRITGHEYNNRMTLVRKCIEMIFHSMGKKGILPNKKNRGEWVLHDILVDNRGSINSTWCSKIISGKEITDKDGNPIVVSYKNIVPNVLKESIYRLIETAAAYEHAINHDATEEQKANSRQTADFLDSINNAPYLLRGMAMDLCNIVLWYDNYITNNPDEEINALNWDIVVSSNHK